MSIIISGGTVVNEGQHFVGIVVIDNDTISDVRVGVNNCCITGDDTIIDATGCIVMPGVIDTHVHFREPGLTEKADIETESAAAVAGGVTTFFDMPNTKPQTTTLEALADKRKRARAKSHVNYAFFFGATNDNYHLFKQLNPHTTPGIKLFMGSSTGNMLVERREALEDIFRTATLPIVAHCELPNDHSANSCYESTRTAVELARKYGARLHVAHVSTARELQFFTDDPAATITAEAVIGHLLFTNDDGNTLGTLIKVNPSIKTATDRAALREALIDRRIRTIGTDHAPHLLSQKTAPTPVSGMPMVQFSLPAMLTIAEEMDGTLTIERIVELMAHTPATLFEVRNRGFLRKGYMADIAIVKREPWVVTRDCVMSKCGWSPLEGRKLNYRVVTTICNGHVVYDGKDVDRSYIGEEVLFR